MPSKKKGNSFGRHKKPGDKNLKRSEQETRLDLRQQKKAKLDKSDFVNEQREQDPSYGRQTRVVLEETPTTKQPETESLFYNVRIDYDSTKPLPRQNIFNLLSEKTVSTWHAAYGSAASASASDGALPVRVRWSSSFDGEGEGIVCDKYDTQYDTVIV